MGGIYDSAFENSYRMQLCSRLLLPECRLKTLRDLCLECVGKNLHCITRASQYLAPLHKELIIERLAFHDLLTPEYLPHVTYNLFSPRLTRINFYKCPQIDETLLKLLAKSECKLQHLTIHDCKQVGDGAVLTITKDQTELCVLQLIKLRFTKKGVQNIKSSHLHTVNLRGCSELESAGVDTIVTNNRCIKQLNLVGCNKLTEQVFFSISEGLKENLETLDIADVHCMTDDGLTSVATNCPNIKSINLLGCNKVTGDSISKLLLACRGLRQVDLSFCSKLVPSPASAQLFLSQLPAQLEDLVLNGLQLNDEQILADGIGSLGNLKRLTLSGVPGLTDRSMEQIMQSLGARLEYFDMRGSVMSQVTDKGLRSVALYCQSLQVLGLSLVKNVTGLTLVPLFEDHQRAPLLRRLMLANRQLDASVLQTIVDNCCNLKELSVSGLAIVNDQILQQLANNCRGLFYISIKACRNVTDVGVMALARECPLCVAVLSGLHNITDRSILTLANNCPYLEELYISGCDLVSPAAVNYLKEQCIARVHVLHKVYKMLDTRDFHGQYI